MAPDGPPDERSSTGDESPGVTDDESPDPADDAPRDPADDDSTPRSLDEPPAARQEETTVGKEDSNTLMNAVVGAVVTFITTFFVPLAPILGGAVAAYLEGEDSNEGLKVGALSGGLALLPLLLAVPLFLLIFLFEPVAGLFVFVFGFFLVAFLAAYTVGLGALGGLLGAYLKREA